MKCENCHLGQEQYSAGVAMILVEEAVTPQRDADRTATRGKKGRKETDRTAKVRSLKRKM